MPKFKIIINESIRFRPMTIEAGDKDDAEELAIRRWPTKWGVGFDPMPTSNMRKYDCRVGKMMFPAMLGTVKSNVSSLAFDTEMVEEDEAI